MIKKSSKLVIIGSGPSGLGAADNAKSHGLRFKLFESQSVPFGHCKSFTLKNFEHIFFDEGPHISFTKKQKVQDLFEASSSEYHILQPKMMNFWKGHYVHHPVQNNLFQVPQPYREQIINGIKNRKNRTSFTSYREWLETAFGNEFSDLFHEVYTKKYWTVASKKMTTEWIGERISQPSAKEMIESAELQKPTDNPHYFTHFRYPKSGGFETFLKKSYLQNKDKIYFNHEVSQIDVVNKKISFSNGTSEGFDHLISSIPLDEIAYLILNCPQDVVEASQKLLATSVTLFSIIYKKHYEIPSHWMYIYDEEIPFARLYFPKALTNQSDESIQAVQVEVYSSKEKPLNEHMVAEKNIISSLEKMAILKSDDVLKVDVKFCKHANVVFDHNREYNLKVVQAYLKKHNIWGVGRFGEWAYLWSDDSYMSGFNAVEEIVQT